MRFFLILVYHSALFFSLSRVEPLFSLEMRPYFLDINPFLPQYMPGTVVPRIGKALPRRVGCRHLFLLLTSSCFLRREADFRFPPILPQKMPVVLGFEPVSFVLTDYSWCIV